MFKKHKINDKKVLHKIGKHWAVISIAILGMIGGVSAYQQNVNAMPETEQGDWSNVTNKLNEAQSASQGEYTNPINSAATSSFDSSMDAYQQQADSASESASMQSEDDQGQQKYDSWVAKYGDPLDDNDGGYNPTSSSVSSSDNETDYNPTIISQASSAIDNDVNQLTNDNNVLNSYQSEIEDSGYNDNVLLDSDYGPDSVVDDADFKITHEDNASEAASLEDAANSAAVSANNYVTSVGNVINSLNDNYSDDSTDSSSDTYIASSNKKKHKKFKARKSSKTKKVAYRHRYSKHHNKHSNKYKYLKKSTRKYKIKKYHKRYYMKRHATVLPRTFSKYWNKTRYVRVKHGFRAYEVHDVVPEYRSKIVKSKWIRSNSKISIRRRGIEWMWTLGGKGLRHHGHYYWMFNGDGYHPNHFKKM